MRIALVFPPYRHKHFAENLKIVDDRFGRFPPLHLLYAATFMKRAGHEILFVDAHAEGLSPKRCLDRIKAFNPALLCFNVTTYMFYDTMKWIRYLKDGTGLPVLCGGINLWLYPKETMSHTEIDYAIIGEAEPALSQFLETFQNHEPMDNIKGLARRVGGDAIINPPDDKKPDFDAYPLPAREELDNRLYFEHISQRKNFTVALTALGCPYKCTFCAIAEKQPSFRRPENALAEIDECYYRYNIREIDYFDAVFTVNRRRTEAICQGILDGGYDIAWACRARVDNVDRDLIGLMARSGCARIYFGIETADSQIMENINKGVDLESARQAIDWCKAHGVRPLGFFMIGAPGEDRNSAAKTVRLSKKLGLDYAQYSRMIAKPQSALNEQLARETGKDYWSDYIAGAERERRIGSPWTRLTEQEIEYLTWRAYLSFYLRPSIIWKHLRHLKSPGELLRYVSVAIAMLVNKRERF